MKTAVAYPRVSSDEQERKGYSLPEQEESLKRWAEQNDVQILATFPEDYSSKNGFNRPAFNKLLEFVKSHKGKIDYLLFVNWTRFGRNELSMHNMISKLMALGIICIPTEQYLDMGVPENRVFRAMYIAMAESDNERRSINIRKGIHQAQLQGRWVSGAPIGYRIIRENSRPLLIPDLDKAEFIREAFTHMSTGNLSASEVLFELRKKGFKYHQSKFYEILRNKVYKGYVKVSAFGGEPERWIRGLHEPLISEQIFDQVQEVLSGRSTKKTKTILKNELLPLRGFLTCQADGGLLTGSGSRGRHGKVYYYYHCDSKKCPERFRADKAEMALLLLLKNLSIPKPVIEIISLFCQEHFAGKSHLRAKELQQISNHLLKISERKEQLQNNLMDQVITGSEYQEIKTRLEAEASKLESRKLQLHLVSADFEQKVNYLLLLLSDLPKYYLQANIAAKRVLLGSIFKEKLIYDGENYRTPALSEMLSFFTQNINNIHQQNTPLRLDTERRVALGRAEATHLETFLDELEVFYTSLKDVIIV